MEFKTRGDAEHFLFFYGFLAGFKPAITHTFRTSNKKRNNEVTKVELKCNKHGKTKKADQQEQDNCIEHQGSEKGPKRNTNVQVKTDCRVVMVIKEHQQKWVIDRLDLEHNHDLRPADSNNMFSGHKYMTEMEKGTGTVGGNNAENQSRPIVEILKNPEAVKQKGRPKKPTRLKPIVEEIRSKMKKAEQKKKQENKQCSSKYV